MRITVELLAQLEQRTNPLGERELVMRELGIPAIENMGPIAARNDLDAWDVSNNRLFRLENFPRLPRLTSLYAAGNLIERVDAANLAKNVPNLQYLILSHNHISSLAEIFHLAKACPKLSVLSLTGNPVTNANKIKLAEREQAKRLAHSAAGAALHADVQFEARQQQRADAAAHPKTFVPGETPEDHDDASYHQAAGAGARSFVTATFTAEQKKLIRQLLAQATSAKEVEDIERAVRQGVLPPGLLQLQHQQEQQQQPQGRDDQHGAVDVSAVATASKKRSLEQHADDVPKLAAETMVTTAATAEEGELEGGKKRISAEPATTTTAVPKMPVHETQQGEGATPSDETVDPRPSKVARVEEFVSS